MGYSTRTLDAYLGRSLPAERFTYASGYTNTLNTGEQSRYTSREVSLSPCVPYL